MPPTTLSGLSDAPAVSPAPTDPRLAHREHAHRGPRLHDDARARRAAELRGLNGGPTRTTHQNVYAFERGETGGVCRGRAVFTTAKILRRPIAAAVTAANGDDDDDYDTIGDGVRSVARVAAFGAAAAFTFSGRPAATAATGTALYAVATGRLATSPLARHRAAAQPAQHSNVPLLRRPVPPRQVSESSRNQRPGAAGEQGPLPPSPRVLAPSLTAPPMPIGKPKTSSGNSFQQWSQRLNSTAAMDKECVKARKILQSFLGCAAEDPKPAPNRSSKPPIQIPDAVLQQAHGLAIYTVIRAGLNLSGSRGSGVVLARLPSPSSVYGAGATLIGGFDVSESVCVLNTEEAVRAFYASTTSRGAELGNYQRNSVRLSGGGKGGSVGGARRGGGPYRRQ
ncbi:hypothetical protein PG997_000171 [Apiospora hydei]|uniref:Uncharacterized protein n=1 Tax=Apiospora hydei TaxID=1337664 RepID=A0ABR1X9T4_9PEZI